jgi:formate dehydrogenase major subunit
MLHELSRRQFMKAAGAGLGGSAAAALGFGGAEEALAQAVRPFKLARTTETRNTCPYCSVGCGIIMYSLGDKAKNVVSGIIHIEGDPDHPVNRGTLCPKGAALLDFVHSENRPSTPQCAGRAPSGVPHQLGRGARPHRQADEGRPRQELRRHQPDGKTSTAGPARACWRLGLVQRNGLHDHKVVRSTGMLVFDNQARV